MSLCDVRRELYLLCGSDLDFGVLLGTRAQPFQGGAESVPSIRGWLQSIPSQRVRHDLATEYMCVRECVCVRVCVLLQNGREKYKGLYFPTWEEGQFRCSNETVNILFFLFLFL